MSEADAAQLMQRVRAVVARVCRSASQADLEDVAADVVEDVLLHHRGPGLPAARWLRWRAINAAKRHSRDHGVLWAPERIEQC